jgi:3-deoxy-D-manno-octulosonic-acid transferase
VADRLGEFGIAAYRLCGSIMRPVVPLFLSARAARGKEDRARVAERYGRPSLKRPDGRLIWVNAASVGETNAALALVGRLTRAGFPVLFTSTTVTSAKIAAARLPKGAIHQFAPLDLPAFVDSFLEHWRPYLVIFVESEVWPTVVTRLEQAVVPLVIVNGRLSDGSFRRWRRFAPLARAVFERIGLVLAQSDVDGDRFRALGAERVTVTGNLKFDALPPDAAEDEIARVSAAIGGRPVWIAASTHAGEEEACVAAHRLLRERFPDLLTIIVPRHPSRGSEIRDALTASGLATGQRSRGEPPAAATEIYLADTLDELGLFFRVAPVAFLGGSLATTGGHNPIEPIRLGVPVVHGPHVHNFAALYARIDEVRPQALVTDATGLAAAVAALLADAGLRANWVSDATAALSPLSGALDATMTALQPYLSGKFYSP